MRDDTDKLSYMLSKLGADLLEVEPILKAKFGIGSIEDLAGLQGGDTIIITTTTTTTTIIIIVIIS